MSTVGVWALSAAVLVGAVAAANSLRRLGRQRRRPRRGGAGKAAPKIVEVKRDPETGIYRAAGDRPRRRD